MLHTPSNALGTVVPLYGAGPNAAGGGGTFAGPRDAHRIVVGFDSVPYADTGTDADFLDPGDGTGIQAALVAAAALGFPCDIRLRPGTATLTAVTALLTVPAGCRLIGAEIGESTIIGYAGSLTVSQQMLALGVNAGVEHLTLTSPSPTVLGALAANGLIVGAAGSFVRHVKVTMNQNVDAPDRTVTNAFYDATPAGVEIDTFDVFYSALTPAIAGIAVRFEAAAAYAAGAQPGAAFPPSNVRNVTMQNGIDAVASTNWYDATVSNVRHTNASQSIVLFDTTTLFAPGANIIGPRVHVVTGTSSGDNNFAAVSVLNTTTAGAMLVHGTDIADVTVFNDANHALGVTVVVQIVAGGTVTFKSSNIERVTAPLADILVALMATVEGSRIDDSHVSKIGGTGAIFMGTSAGLGGTQQHNIVLNSTIDTLTIEANVVSAVIGFSKITTISDSGTTTEIGHVVT